MSAKLIIDIKSGEAMERSGSSGTQKTSHREEIAYATFRAEEPLSIGASQRKMHSVLWPYRKEEVKLSSSICWREGRQGVGLKGKQGEMVG